VPSPTPTPTPVAQNVLPEPASQPDADEGNGKDDSDPIATSNQFSTLVEASAVNFSSSREVENVDDTTIKVRLSRGQVRFNPNFSGCTDSQRNVSFWGHIAYGSNMDRSPFMAPSFMLLLLPIASMHQLLTHYRRLKH
jgi:hypothetical protein